MSEMLEKALDRIGAESKKLIDEARDEKDLLAIATALVMKAEIIYTTMGGRKHSAMQFYAVADRMANGEDDRR